MGRPSYVPWTQRRPETLVKDIYDLVMHGPMPSARMDEVTPEVARDAYDPKAVAAVQVIQEIRPIVKYLDSERKADLATRVKDLPPEACLESAHELSREFAFFNKEETVDLFDKVIKNIMVSPEESNEILFLARSSGLLLRYHEDKIKNLKATNEDIRRVLENAVHYPTVRTHWHENIRTSPGKLIERALTVTDDPRSRLCSLGEAAEAVHQQIQTGRQMQESRQIYPSSSRRPREMSRNRDVFSI